jgi:hypothetical protein
MASLFQELFGDGSILTKDAQTRQWTFTPLPGFSKLQGEGVVSYLLRLVASGQVLFIRGSWDQSSEYCIGSAVFYNNLWWVALSANQNSTPGIDPNVWSQLLYSLEGLQGPAGAPATNVITG